MNWEMKRAENEVETEQLLREGWEPFSFDYFIANNIIVTRYLWFKRKSRVTKPLDNT